MTAPASSTDRTSPTVAERAIGATPTFVAYRVKLGAKAVLGLRMAPALFAAGASETPLARRSSIERASDLAARHNANLPAGFEDALGHYLEDFAWLADPHPAVAALAPILPGIVPENRPGLWQVVDVDPQQFFQPVTTALPPPAVARVATALAEALSALHQRGCLHLDVCPDLIARDGGTARLCGLGFPLREWASPGKPGNFLARMETAPPEMADLSRRSLLGPWTDIFQASATLFWLATGAPPPDYRARAAMPEKGRPAIRAALAESGLAAEWPQLAEAIALGLALPRLDRPQTALAWIDPAWYRQGPPTPPPTGSPPSQSHPSQPTAPIAPPAEPSATLRIVAQDPARRTDRPTSRQRKTMAAVVGIMIVIGTTSLLASRFHTTGEGRNAPAASMPMPAARPASAPASVAPLSDPPAPAPTAASPFASLTGIYSNDAASAGVGGCEKPLEIEAPEAATSPFALTVIRQNGDTWQLAAEGKPGQFVLQRSIDLKGNPITPPGSKPRWIIARDGSKLTFTYAGTEFTEEYWLCTQQ